MKDLVQPTPVELPLMANEPVWAASMLVEYRGFWRCYSARDLGVTDRARMAFAKDDAKGGAYDGDVKVSAYRFK